MKSRYYVTICIFIIASQALTQEQFSEDNLAKMVICIGDVSDNKTKLLGTATIISESDNYYILTAAHISDSIKGKCVIIFQVGNDQAAVLPLEWFIQNKTVKWITHSEADLSVIKIKAFDEDSKARLEQWNFPISQIIIEKQPIPRDLNITALGFPIVNELGKHFSPFTFHSYFSSGLITLKRGDTRMQSTFQLLENPSIQGYSGGPIFIGVSRAGVSLGPNQTILVGVMHGTYADKTGGKLAMVTPGFYIHELLNNVQSSE